MPSVLDTLRKVKENRKTVSVNIDGQTVQLNRVDAATYQEILQEVSDQSQGGMTIAMSFDFTAKCVTHVVDGLDLEEAKDLLAACGGINGEFAKAVLDACGINSVNVSDDLMEGDGGN